MKYGPTFFDFGRSDLRPVTSVAPRRAPTDGRHWYLLNKYDAVMALPGRLYGHPSCSKRGTMRRWFISSPRRSQDDQSFVYSCLLLLFLTGAKLIQECSIYVDFLYIGYSGIWSIWTKFSKLFSNPNFSRLVSIILPKKMS